MHQPERRAFPPFSACLRLGSLPAARKHSEVAAVTVAGQFGACCKPRSACKGAAPATPPAYGWTLTSTWLASAGRRFG
jgi:hypothetical protein